MDGQTRAIAAAFSHCKEDVPFFRRDFHSCSVNDTGQYGAGDDLWGRAPFPFTFLTGDLGRCRVHPRCKPQPIQADLRLGQDSSHTSGNDPLIQIPPGRCPGLSPSAPSGRTNPITYDAGPHPLQRGRRRRDPRPRDMTGGGGPCTTGKEVTRRGLSAKCPDSQMRRRVCTVRIHVEKDTRSPLCEAPSRPFRQKTPGVFFAVPALALSLIPKAVPRSCGMSRDQGPCSPMLARPAIRHRTYELER